MDVDNKSLNMQKRRKGQKMQVHGKESKEDAVPCVENLLGWTRERLGDGRVDVRRNNSHSPSTQDVLTSGLLTQDSCKQRQDILAIRKKVPSDIS